MKTELHTEDEPSSNFNLYSCVTLFENPSTSDVQFVHSNSQQ